MKDDDEIIMLQSKWSEIPGLLRHLTTKYEPKRNAQVTKSVRDCCWIYTIGTTYAK